MRNQNTRLLTQAAYCLGAAAAWLIVMTHAAPARQTAPTGPPSGTPNPKAESRQRELRETMLRNGELGAAMEKRDQRRIEAAIEQVRQDFRQIQIVRNEIVRNLLAEKPLSYKLISVEVGEINKRAERLKIYLMAPAPQEKEKNQKDHIEFGQDQMKDALVQLCNRIASFIDNPILKTPGTVDVEQSTQAGGELLYIIELSGNIKRSAERLNKASK